VNFPNFGRPTGKRLLSACELQCYVRRAERVSISRFPDFRVTASDRSLPLPLTLQLRPRLLLHIDFSTNLTIDDLCNFARALQEEGQGCLFGQQRNVPLPTTLRLRITRL